MNEFEEKLNAILGDPAEMERIARLASELMGGGDFSGTASAAPPAQTGSAVPPVPDGELLRRLTRLLGSGSAGADKTPLLQALAPYLKPERQAKLQKALRMAKMAKLARAALEDYGG